MVLFRAAFQPSGYGSWFHAVVNLAQDQKAPLLSCAAPGGKRRSAASGGVSKPLSRKRHSLRLFETANCNAATVEESPGLPLFRAAFQPGGYESWFHAAVTSAFPESASSFLGRGSVQGLWKPGSHVCESGGCPPLLYPTAGRGVEFSVNSSILCRV